MRKSQEPTSAPGRQGVSPLPDAIGNPYSTLLDEFPRFFAARAPCPVRVREVIHFEVIGTDRDVLKTFARGAWIG
jgi:hypothetical protein